MGSRKIVGWNFKKEKRSENATLKFYIHPSPVKTCYSSQRLCVYNSTILLVIIFRWFLTGLQRGQLSGLGWPVGRPGPPWSMTIRTQVNRGASVTSVQKGLSPLADLMPGGMEATVFILQGLPRCSTPLFCPLFSESSIVFSAHDLVWPPFMDLKKLEIWK